MTQSLAPTSHVWNLLDPPHFGVQRTLLFSLIIFCLNLVSFMYHWFFARSMRGVLQRQQWGYECSIVSSLNSNPLVSRSLTITGFASLTWSPVYFPASGVKCPDPSTGERTGSPFRWPTSKSSSPCPGAMWTSPVPSVIVTYSELRNTL